MGFIENSCYDVLCGKRNTKYCEMKGENCEYYKSKRVELLKSLIEHSLKTYPEVHALYGDLGVKKPIPSEISRKMNSLFTKTKKIESKLNKKQI